MSDDNTQARQYTIEDAEAAILSQAEAILRRRHDESVARTNVANPESAAGILRMHLGHLDREVFTVLFLDTRHRVIAMEDLFYGSIDGSEVHPRELVKRALILNAAALIVAHNHPSGVGEPSAADRAVTARIKQALALVDVRLIDHFVVTAGAPVSMAARGWV